MNTLIINKKVIIKNRILLLAFYLLAITLVVIVIVSACHILSADFHYMKYKDAKRASNPTLELKTISKALSINHTNPEYFYEFGNAFYKAYEEEYKYQSSTTEDSNNALLHDSLIDEDFNWLKNLVPFDNAKVIPSTMYKEAIRNNPAKSDAYYRLGLMEILSEKTESIEKLFATARLFDPQNIFLHYSIGVYYLWNKNLQKAFDEFREIVLISNITGDFLSDYYDNILNQVYLFSTDYEILAKINPISYEAYLALANFLHTKNQWNDSKKAYYKAIKLAPLAKKGELAYIFANAAAVNNDWEEVETIHEIFESYISADKKSHPLFTILMIKCNYSQEHFEEVIKDARKVITLDPQNYQPYYFAGLSLLRLDRKIEGLYYLEQAAKLSPDNIYVHRTLAFAYESANKLNKAIKEWEAILQLTKANQTNEALYTDALKNILRLQSKLR